MRVLFLFFFFWTSSALGQTFPEHQSTTVNDFAGLLDAAEVSRLSAQLDDLRRETGVEMTVLTLNTQSEYAPRLTLERFATRLFDEWGIGDAYRNDGLLVLILRNDRAMRIELGAAYARDWDRVAEHIVEDTFLPAFSTGDYPRGIAQGVTAIIDQIIGPFQAGETAPGWGFPIPSEAAIIFAVLGVIGLISGRRRIGDGLARLRKCPNCGRRGLHQTRNVQFPATATNSGAGIRRLRCDHCDYDVETTYFIQRHYSNSGDSSGGGFGGGSSGGGGASGRW